MTTHPADGAGRNPDRIEHGFLPLKVNIHLSFLFVPLFT